MKRWQATKHTVKNGQIQKGEEPQKGEPSKQELTATNPPRWQANYPADPPAQGHTLRKRTSHPMPPPHARQPHLRWPQLASSTASQSTRQHSTYHRSLTPLNSDKKFMLPPPQEGVQVLMKTCEISTCTLR
eukprot:964458-Amphidinium_carterae.1